MADTMEKGYSPIPTKMFIQGGGLLATKQDKEPIFLMILESDSWGTGRKTSLLKANGFCQTEISMKGSFKITSQVARESGISKITMSKKEFTIKLLFQTRMQMTRE